MKIPYTIDLRKTMVGIPSVKGELKFITYTNVKIIESHFAMYTFSFILIVQAALIQSRLHLIIMLFLIFLDSLVHKNLYSPVASSLSLFTNRACVMFLLKGCF